ncbi:MAG: transposase [Ectobacillus sp.]
MLEWSHHNNIQHKNKERFFCHECGGCPFRSDCTTSRYGRTTQWSPVYDEQKKKARERLESERGQALYRPRKIDIESVFG